MLYPEIYYKVEPYILSACDEMHSFGSAMPNKKAISAMSEKVYKQVTEAYPELRNYETESIDVKAARSNGLFRDFLDVLLIYELIGRRRF